MTRETSRQTVHIACVLFALTFRFLTPSWALLLAMTAFIHNVFILPKYAPQVFRKDEGMCQGIALYPLMVALLILFFPDRLNLAAGGWAILACGDGFSTLVGKRFPLAAIPWHPKKSFGGMLAFILFAGTGAFLLMAWTGPVPSFNHLLFVAFGAAAVAAVYETLPLPWDDNIVVTLIGAAFLALLWNLDIAVEPLTFSAETWVLAIEINVCVAGLAWMLALVSLSGAIGGGIMGILIYALGGWNLFLLLVIFFVLASGATKYGYQEKKKIGGAQEKGGRRGAKHAAANCLCPLIAAVVLGFTQGADLLIALFFCAALATALSDTISSELGQVFGKNPFLPTTFKPVSPGTVGAVSVEGTLFGMAASLVIALCAYAVDAIPVNFIPAVTLGGWAGFYIESYIGAYWTEKGIDVSNEWMNLMNTFAGGTTALIVVTVTHAL